MAKVLLPINAYRACITAGPTYIITNRQLPKLGLLMWQFLNLLNI